MALLFIASFVATYLGDAAPTASTSPLLWVVVTLAAGSGGTIAVQMWMRHKRGAAEDVELANRISDKVMSGAHELLDEYRIKLEAAQLLIESYQTQLAELNRLLGAANARIERLENDLAKSTSGSRDLERKLAEATRERDGLHHEIDGLQARIEELEHQLEVHHPRGSS